MDLKEFEKIVSKNGDYGLCPPPIEAQEGLNVLIDYFLGEDWYVTMPVSQEQCNTEAIHSILSLYRTKHHAKKNILDNSLGMNKFCELLGHKLSQTALLICAIKGNALNRGKPNIMRCERCEWTLDLNNKEAVDAYSKHRQQRSFLRTLWNMITVKNSART